MCTNQMDILDPESHWIFEQPIKEFTSQQVTSAMTTLWWNINASIEDYIEKEMSEYVMPDMVYFREIFRPVVRLIPPDCETCSDRRGPLFPLHDSEAAKKEYVRKRLFAHAFGRAFWEFFDAYYKPVSDKEMTVPLADIRRRYQELDPSFNVEASVFQDIFHCVFCIQVQADAVHIRGLIEFITVDDSDSESV